MTSSIILRIFLNQGFSLLQKSSCNAKLNGVEFVVQYKIWCGELISRLSILSPSRGLNFSAWTHGRSRVNWKEFVRCQMRAEEIYSEAKCQFQKRSCQFRVRNRDVFMNGQHLFWSTLKFALLELILFSACWWGWRISMFVSSQGWFAVRSVWQQAVQGVCWCAFCLTSIF